jgi:hypothetical protein
MQKKPPPTQERGQVSALDTAPAGPQGSVSTAFPKKTLQLIGLCGARNDAWASTPVGLTWLV